MQIVWKDIQHHGRTSVACGLAFAVMGVWVSCGLWGGLPWYAWMVAAVGVIAVAPFLSCELLAEERRAGTWEFLKRLPVSRNRVALEKVAAALILVHVALGVAVTSAVIGVTYCTTPVGLSLERLLAVFRSGVQDLCGLEACLVALCMSGLLCGRLVTSPVAGGVLGFLLGVVGVGVGRTLYHLAAHSLVTILECLSCPAWRLIAFGVVAAAAGATIVRRRSPCCSWSRAGLVVFIPCTVILCALVAPSLWLSWKVDSAHVTDIISFGVQVDKRQCIIIGRVQPTPFDLRRWSHAVPLRVDLDTGVRELVYGPTGEVLFPHRAARVAGVWHSFNCAILCPSTALS